MTTKKPENFKCIFVYRRTLQTFVMCEREKVQIFIRFHSTVTITLDFENLAQKKRTQRHTHLKMDLIQLYANDMHAKEKLMNHLFSMQFSCSRWIGGSLMKTPLIEFFTVSAAIANFHSKLRDYLLHNLIYASRN